jgi:hypothetical protein
MLIIYFILTIVSAVLTYYASEKFRVEILVITVALAFLTIYSGLTENRVAVYDWTNENSWISNPDNENPGEYDTDLDFVANGKTLPHSVCPVIEAGGVTKIISDQSIDSSYIYTLNDNGWPCIQSPKSSLIIELITQGKPTRIPEAELNNQ